MEEMLHRLSTKPVLRAGAEMLKLGLRWRCLNRKSLRWGQIKMVMWSEETLNTTDSEDEWVQIKTSMMTFLRKKNLFGSIRLQIETMFTDKQYFDTFYNFVFQKQDEMCLISEKISSLSPSSWRSWCWIARGQRSAEYKYGARLRDDLLSLLQKINAPLFVSTARKADPRVRGRATFATGEREASPGGDGGVRAGPGADGVAAAAVLQVHRPGFCRTSDPELEGPVLWVGPVYVLKYMLELSILVLLL